MTNFKDLLDVDREFGSAAPKELRSKYGKRGRLKTSMGLPTAIDDLLRAYALRSTSSLPQGMPTTDLLDHYQKDLATGQAHYSEYGIIGEALRIHVRDRLLSLPNANASAAEWLQLSIKSFDRALELLNAEPKASTDHKAWTLAHAASSRATLYWLTRTPNGDQRLFDQAEEMFRRSLSIREDPWTRRFLALLFALRAIPGDFQRATSELAQVKSGSTLVQSSIQRALAILLGQSAWESPMGSREPNPGPTAARRSMHEGMLAVTEDPEDAIAAHFVASSAYWLYLNELASNGPDTLLLKDHTRLALESASFRALNMFSQASACLASLNVLRAELMDDPEKKRAAIHRASYFLDTVDSSGVLDPETRLLFERDPVIRHINKTKPPEYEQFTARCNATSLNFQEERK